MGASKRPRFGTDGVRGVAGDELTPDFVRLLGRAAAHVLSVRRVYVARDTRESSLMLEQALAAGLRDGGCEVTSMAMVPTPALAWLAARDGVAAAMITASHNPYTDNGVKVFAAGGLKLSDAVEQAIEARLDELDPLSAGSPADTPVAVDPRGASRYVEHLVSSFPQRMLAGMRVVVDCANGAMSSVAPDVLSGLGADLVVLHATPDGTNINDGCGATHPEGLLRAVRENQADVGLAFDGDGDRLIAATVSGLIDGDRLMAVVAPALRDAGELAQNAVAVTVMSNLGLRKAMDRHGIRVIETAVGDRYVLEALEREGLALGGEQSGHIIFRNRSTTGDGLLAALVLLEAAARSGETLDSLSTKAMTSFPQVLVNVRTARRDPNIVTAVADEIASTEAALGDEGRVLVRPSGTEPVVRVMVEAASEELASAEAERLAAVIAERLA